VINHIEESLSMRGVACQTDLLGAALWRFGFGEIDKGEVGPINWTNG